jgi:hypothetical protein
VLPYVSWLQTRPNGLLIAFWQVRLRGLSCVRWLHNDSCPRGVCVCAHQGNALVFLATVIRTIPCWAPAHLRANFYMQWTLHVGISSTVLLCAALPGLTLHVFYDSFALAHTFHSPQARSSTPPLAPS